MFIIELTYKVPLEIIDNYMKDHVHFLEAYQSKGVFISWGRKVPRNGGIIIAEAKDKKELKKMMLEDPFTKNRLAKMRIIEFINRRPLSS